MNYEKIKEYGFEVSEKAVEILNEAEDAARPHFKRLEEIAEINSQKVLGAFIKNRASAIHFASTSGYGHDDMGRDTLDNIFADIFHAECAMVRHNIVSGTAAIAACLYGVLRPGDTLISLCGAPYDTIQEVIGICGEQGIGTLIDYGVKYEQIELKDDKPDISEIARAAKLKKPKAVLIQRSKGYAWRSSLSIEQIGEIISAVKEKSPETVCIVDNCYGEFVETKEPTDAGADIAVGSLIKNAGGSLAQSGGYIVGKEKYLDMVAARLTAPGLGRDAGPSLGSNKSMYQGVFMAPHIVCQSLKTACLAAAAFSKMGYDVCPKTDDVRYDIIQAVKLGSEEKLIKFCKGIQSGSPIDSHVSPEPWAMPGYEDKVIMAAGTFVQGASIELSADGPIREPYTVYMQGGIVYESAKIGVLFAIDKILGGDL